MIFSSLNSTRLLAVDGVDFCDSTEISRMSFTKGVLVSCSPFSSTDLVRSILVGIGFQVPCQEPFDLIVCFPL